jgi:hypothetical protein
MFSMISSTSSFKEGRENELLVFLRNAQYYIENGEVCIVVRKREDIDENKLYLLNPDMLYWKKFMMPLFIDWLISTEHSIRDGKGNWKNDAELIKARWCELNICSRNCLVDFKSRTYDTEESYWEKTKKYNYIIIIDPYYCDPTDDDWNIDWIG